MLHRPSGSNKGLPARFAEARRAGEAGISIVELLVGAGILTMSLSVLLGFLSFTITAASLVKQQTQATALAQGALEAVRNFRDGVAWNADDPQNQYDGLGRMQTGVPYHAQVSQDIPPKWQLLSGAEAMGVFARTIVFENAQRDVDNNIVQAGGIEDSDTKKVTVTVSWQAKAATQEIALVSYLTNWKQ